MNCIFSRNLLVGGMFILASVVSAGAQSAEELAKKLSNPIASMISVPFQFNWDQGYVTGNGDKMTLNIQPVIPISLNDEWNLISRTIVPVIHQDNVFGDFTNQYGLGDTVQSFWLSPKAPTNAGLIWGLGPVIYIPTATDTKLGADTWGAGPTAIALTQSGPWTVGALANHIWSFDNHVINSTFVQPFLNYTTPTAWTFGLNTESTYNWNTEEWSVPINASISKLVDIGGQKVSLQGGVGYWANSSTGGADGWRARFTVTFLFPIDV